MKRGTENASGRNAWVYTIATSQCVSAPFAPARCQSKRANAARGKEGPRPNAPQKLETRRRDGEAREREIEGKQQTRHLRRLCVAPSHISILPPSLPSPLHPAPQLSLPLPSKAPAPWSTHWTPLHSPKPLVPRFCSLLRLQPISLGPGHDLAIRPSLLPPQLPPLPPFSTLHPLETKMD